MIEVESNLVRLKDVESEDGLSSYLKLQNAEIKGSNSSKTEFKVDRGLSAIGNRPQQDIQNFKTQSHLVWVSEKYFEQQQGSSK